MSMPSLALSNGAKLPVIGFGTYKISGPRCSETVYDAIKIGYRNLDTASIYGNEDGVGEGVIKAIKDGIIKRNDVIITTKVWPDCDTYDRARSSIKRSIRAMGKEVGYVDIVLIHWPGKFGSEKQDQSSAEKVRSEMWRALEDAQTEGETKAIGISNFNKRHIETLLKSSRPDGKPRIQPVINQIELQILNYKSCLETLEYCKSKSIVVQAYSPLCQGKVFSNLNLRKALEDILKPCGYGLPEAMLKYIIQKGHAVIPKSSSIERMKNNFSVAMLKDIPNDVIDKMENLLSDDNKIASFGIARMFCPCPNSFN